MFGVAEVGSLTAMAIRLRRAKGNEREQIKWFLYAGSFVILGITVEIVLGVPITTASWLGGMVVPFAIAVALFKYRLNTLSGELLTVVDQTMQPTTASLWLRQQDGPP